MTLLENRGEGAEPLPSRSEDPHACQGLKSTKFLLVLLSLCLRHGGTDGADHEVFGGVFGIDQLGHVDSVAGGFETFATQRVGEGDSKLLLEERMLENRCQLAAERRGG